MHLPLRAVEPHIDFGELQRPAMPNGQELGSYLDALLGKFEAYVRESIVMLPNIDAKLIAPERLSNP
ncbi:MAG: hypothetical protein Q7R30_11095 [Acidobacteriota bacterium]|nr:hypothetical protein [Acidobacteriota bacterium]